MAAEDPQRAAHPGWPDTASLSLSYERGIWGKAHMVATDYRWLARSDGLKVSHEDLRLGHADKPTQAYAWKALDSGRYIAMKVYASMARDRAQAIRPLEQHVLEWSADGTHPANAAFALFEVLQPLKHRFWWQHRTDEGWQRNDFQLHIPPPELPAAALSPDALEGLRVEGLAELRTRIRPEKLADLLFSARAGVPRPLVVSGLSEPLPSRAIAALLLFFSPSELRALSVTGWLQSVRTSTDDLQGRWQIIFSANDVPGAASLQAAPAAWRRAVEGALDGNPTAYRVLLAQLVSQPAVVSPPSEPEPAPPEPAPERIDPLTLPSRERWELASGWLGGSDPQQILERCRALITFQSTRPLINMILKLALTPPTDANELKALVERKDECWPEVLEPDDYRVFLLRLWQRTQSGGGGHSLLTHKILHSLLCAACPDEALYKQMGAIDYSHEPPWSPLSFFPNFRREQWPRMLSVHFERLDGWMAHNRGFLASRVSDWLEKRTQKSDWPEQKQALWGWLNRTSSVPSAREQPDPPVQAQRTPTLAPPRQPERIVERGSGFLPPLSSPTRHSNQTGDTLRHIASQNTQKNMVNTVRASELLHRIADLVKLHEERTKDGMPFKQRFESNTFNYGLNEELEIVRQKHHIETRQLVHVATYLLRKLGQQ